MMNENRILFKSPTTLLIGNGVISEAGIYIKRLNINKVLIVTDPVLIRLGVVEPLKEVLEKELIQYEIYDATKPDPPVENCYDAFEIYAKTNCQGVVGIGGGSAIDVAKIVAMLATNPGKFENYAGIGKVLKKCAPLVLIPTTSGTGSEVSNFSIMIVNGSKMGVVDPNIIADVALVDPLLTLGVPRDITAATGLDALCHHLESYLSINASPLCDAICLEGIRVIGKYLPKAVGHPSNKEARYWMSYASTLGGYVMNLTDGAAANHGLAFAIGAKFHVPHGLSNAIMLPFVLPYVGISELQKVRNIGIALGLDLSNYNERESLNIVADAISKLVNDVGCAIPLKRFGAVETDVDALAEEVINTQTRVMGHSTYQLTPEEIKKIFIEALD